MRRREFCLRLVPAFVAASACGQNVVDDSDGKILERRMLTEEELAALLDGAPPLRKPPAAPVAVPEQKKLEAAVVELMDGWPWRPFFHQLGISGAETHFDHPDEMFAAVSAALPWLSPQTAERAQTFLKQRLKEHVPYVPEGYDRAVGRPRENYDVPENLRAKGRRVARDLWGVHALWQYYLATGDRDAVREHWAAVRGRIGALLRADYVFDPKKRDYTHDEAQRLNGDFAGLWAAIHLAKFNEDEATAKSARARAAQLLQLRLDLEKLNPRILDKTDAATKTLHHFKLARYLNLAEPAATLLRQDGTAAERLRPFREARPGWWMAFGDRWIGGENYTTSPDFARALFHGAVEIEAIAPAKSTAWMDVPWCKGDLFQIRKMACFLQSGRPG
jgi:hypothetical protein